VLGWFPVLYIIGQAYGPMLHIPLGRNRVLIQSTVGAMMVNLLGLATVSAKWGAVGAAVVLLVAEACNGLVQMFRARDLIALTDVLRDAAKIVASGAVALLAVRVAKSLSRQSTWSALLFENLAMVLVYVGMVFVARPLGLYVGLDLYRAKNPGSPGPSE